MVSRLTRVNLLLTSRSIVTVTVHASETVAATFFASTAIFDSAGLVVSRFGGGGAGVGVGTGSAGGTGGSPPPGGDGGEQSSRTPPLAAFAVFGVGAAWTNVSLT